jgi:ATP-binding cassette, subfamily B, multidrug efflux pump
LLVATAKGISLPKTKVWVLADLKAKFVAMNPLSHLNRYFYKYRLRFFLGILFVIISNLFGVLPPQIIRYSVDLIAESIQVFKLYEHSGFSELLFNQFTGYLMLFAGLVLVLSLLKGLFMYFMRQTIIVMSRWIEFDMKNEIYEKYQSLSLGFFRRNSTGDLMARVSEDVGKVRMYTGPAMMYGINLIVLFAFVITVMVRVNPTLTLYVLLPLPILSIGIYYVNNLILQRSTAIQEQLARLNTFAQETFSGIRVIKSYGLEPAYRADFELELDEFRKRSMNLVKVDALFYPLTLLLIGLSTIITVFIGGIQVSKGLISPGNIAEFVIYVNMLTWPVTSVGWVASIIQQAAASQARINELLAAKPDIDLELGEKNILQGDISFRKVSYTYPDNGIEALKEVSFDLKPGETLGIIGRTGSGKSTLANLLTRLFDPTSGEILVDGMPLTALHPGFYRSQIGFVPQDVFLFSDSIRNNIAFGSPEAAEAQITWAAEQAALRNTIERLPDGYDTVLGERGITLSGGQKQRLSIARAILKKPALYVIDDCLSALDTNTEKEILTNIHRFTSNVTSVIISHRVSSVMEADHILVLDQGAVVEQGAHEDLLALNGYYASIFSKQQSEPAAQLPEME